MQELHMHIDWDLFVFIITFNLRERWFYISI